MHCSFRGRKMSERIQEKLEMSWWCQWDSHSAKFWGWGTCKRRVLQYHSHQVAISRSFCTLTHKSRACLGQTGLQWHCRTTLSKVSSPRKNFLGQAWRRPAWMLKPFARASPWELLFTTFEGIEDEPPEPFPQESKPEPCCSSSLQCLQKCCCENFSWNRAWKSPWKMPWNFWWNLLFLFLRERSSKVPRTLHDKFRAAFSRTLCNCKDQTSWRFSLCGRLSLT